MSLKNNSKINFIVVAIIITSFIIFFLINKMQLYGNDKNSIEQVIKSIDGYGEGSIEILEIKDIADNRLVGYLDNNNPPYIHFFKNPNGNYEWKHIEKHDGQSFALFLFPLIRHESSFFMIVTNQNNEIGKMELGINELLIDQEFRVNQNSVKWIELPKSNGEGYSYSYKYYNKDGNPISDY